LRGDAQRGVGRVRDAARAVVPEAGLVHAVEPCGLAALVGLAGVARAAHLRELLAVRVVPELQAVALDHSRHAVAQRCRRACGEQVVRQQRQIDVPVRRDDRMRRHGVPLASAPTLGH
jgi:hypothetical protein